MSLPNSLPFVSVIVPHYNDLNGLDACLNALMAQTYPRDRFEIIVGDNNSPVGLDAVCQLAGGRAKVIHAPIKGAGPARNAAVPHARGEILAFTDSDCIPESEWLSEGVKAMEHADFVGGAMTVLVPQDRAKNGAEGFEMVFAFDNRSYVEKQKFTVTANLLCKRDVFTHVGEFRTEVSEDKEWCLRAGDMGYKIGYAAKAVVGHPARADWEQLRKKWQRLNAEGFALFKQRGGKSLVWLLRTWALLPSIPLHSIKILTSPALNGLDEKLKACGMLIRCRLWRFVDGHRLLMQ
ncbi:glycosyltransferase [Novosphingobium umbonatum]|uniref:glycosyltransferase n=1 Tax=Novosphingobium umbonatum TaxID=1908524 RepID=UPI001FEA1387|nr:glycosyltransferase [Novosphingobium umbonatum]